MTGTNKPSLSNHLQQRTREWFRKVEHELAYPAPIPEEITVAEARLAIEQARQIYGIVKR